MKELEARLGRQERQWDRQHGQLTGLENKVAAVRKHFHRLEGSQSRLDKNGWCPCRFWVSCVRPVLFSRCSSVGWWGSVSLRVDGAVVVSQCRGCTQTCSVQCCLVLFSQEQLADDCSAVCDPSPLSTGTVGCSVVCGPCPLSPAFRFVEFPSDSTPSAPFSLSVCLIVDLFLLFPVCLRLLVASFSG